MVVSARFLAGKHEIHHAQSSCGWACTRRLTATSLPGTGALGSPSGALLGAPALPSFLPSLPISSSLCFTLLLFSSPHVSFSKGFSAPKAGPPAETTGDGALGQGHALRGAFQGQTPARGTLSLCSSDQSTCISGTGSPDEMQTPGPPPPRAARPGCCELYEVTR